MDSNTTIIYGLVAIVSIVITIVITRLIFSIPSFLRNQKAQLKLLSEIAIKNGVDADKVDGIITESKGFVHP